MPSKKSPAILVVNDDGIHGPGLWPLVRALRRLGRVTVVVPNEERSADSHSLTLHKPIRVRAFSRDVYTINGSPADCARFGVLEILRSRVDLVASGINNGLNIGEDVIYSGTVAAAMEATLLDIPAAAFSQGRSRLKHDYVLASRWAARLARLTLRHGLPRGICLNVNFPEPSREAFKRPMAVRLGQRVYSKDVTKRADPRGDHYYWLAGKSVTGVNTQGTDVAALAKGHVAITPLHSDTTHHPMLSTLKSWGF